MIFSTPLFKLRGKEWVPNLNLLLTPSLQIVQEGMSPKSLKQFLRQLWWSPYFCGNEVLIFPEKIAKRRSREKLKPITAHAELNIPCASWTCQVLLSGSWSQIWHHLEQADASSSKLKIKSIPCDWRLQKNTPQVWCSVCINYFSLIKSIISKLLAEFFYYICIIAKRGCSSLVLVQ
jgi:hypothetical protein